MRDHAERLGFPGKSGRWKETECFTEEVYDEQPKIRLPLPELGDSEERDTSD